MMAIVAWNKEDFTDVWELFDAAISYADTPTDNSRNTFTKWYNTVSKHKGISWNITMGLYWTRPYFYLNLDGTNRSFLLGSDDTRAIGIENISKLRRVPDAETYLSLIELCQKSFSDSSTTYHSFPELSSAAWLATASNSQEQDTKLSEASFLQWFEPLIEALKDLDGSASPDAVRKQIITNLNLPDEIVNEVRGKTGVKKFDNEVAFARNYLAYDGIIDKTIHGVWALTEKGESVVMTHELASEIFFKWVNILKERRENASDMSIDDLLTGFRSYVSRTKPIGGTANSYKTAMGDALDYLDYKKDISSANFSELKKKVENLQSEFENNSQSVIEKMKPFFSRAESYLTNGFVRASLPYFISYLSDLDSMDQKTTKSKANEKRYWIYAPGENARKWDEFYSSNIMGIGWDELGDLTQYSDREEIRAKMKELSDETKSYKNDSLALWQFYRDISEGDIIFAKKGIRQIIGRGIVESEYIFMPERNEYQHIRKIKWTHNGSWEHPGQAIMKTLTDITTYTEYVQKLELLVVGDNIVDEFEPEDEIKYEEYSDDDFLSEVFTDPEQYETLVTLLKNKKNLILQIGRAHV